MADGYRRFRQATGNVRTGFNKTDFSEQPCSCEIRFPNDDSYQGNTKLFETYSSLRVQVLLDFCRENIHNLVMASIEEVVERLKNNRAEDASLHGGRSVASRAFSALHGLLHGSYAPSSDSCRGPCARPGR